MPLLIYDSAHGTTTETYFDFTYQAYQQQGQTAGISVFAHDVTEQVLARRQVQTLNERLQATNEELRLLNQQLTHSNLDLDNFIYTASHDLRAPITNIEGLLHTLTAEMPAGQRSEEISYILELMQDSVERFKSTIEQLTDVTRLRQEQLPTATLVNIREVLLAVQLDLAPLIHDTGARITRQLTDYASVVFSPKNLRSVLYNLLSNALKYHCPHRPLQITISTRRQNEFLVLEVGDNGLGLPENSRDRLFGMFQRFHSHVEGTGIGLYMVRKMVENAGGRLEVSSQEGIGSLFSVYFRQ
ncbi:sensor histidine kinase [Hymenobacter rubripertinctus]|uniref:histidine kinase n=1 Tax=Hymenobacter rubripertinctus TaxID=2029981 RepID=A0A418R0A7_9BACT|nr:HAMP domain-containing sensor histidine kinase [Hymenobacter rubripertinctus]RIY10831.1 sensor histidine kinase [Hymenobacter rubripertinctus]